MGGLQETVRVLIVSDVRLYSDGLNFLLRENSRFEAIGTACNKEEVLSHLRRSKPSVVLMDPAIARASTISRAISAIDSRVPVIAIAVPDSTHHAVACAEAGFAGYILRDATVEKLLEGIERVISGELLCSPQVAGMLYRRLSRLSRRPEDRLGKALTVREAEILELIEKGLANKEIANCLGLSLSTVKNHVHHILEKLGVQRRGEAAAHVRATASDLEWPMDPDR